MKLRLSQLEIIGETSVETLLEVTEIEPHEYAGVATMLMVQWNDMKGHAPLEDKPSL